MFRCYTLVQLLHLYFCVLKRERLSILALLGLAVCVPQAEAVDILLGEQKTLLVLVNFADSPAPVLSRNNMEYHFFDESNPKSVATYFSEVSYGKMSLVGEVLDWVTLPISSLQGCIDYLDIDSSVAMQRLVDYLDPLVDFFTVSPFWSSRLLPVRLRVCVAIARPLLPCTTSSYKVMKGLSPLALHVFA